MSSKKQKSKPKILPPVVEFDDVRRITAPGKKRSQNGFSLQIHPGELVLFRANPRVKLPDIADLAMGMIKPPQGSVRFLETSWAEMEPDEEREHRFRIGRVFAPQRGRSPWVQNLDIEENITVAQYFHPGMFKEDVMENAQKAGKRFGFEKLPQTRPSSTPAGVLTRAQWVRAFLASPLKLLILERPGFELDPHEVEPLVEAVAEARDDGAAVIWIDSAPDELDHGGLEPTVTYDEVPEPLGSEP